ncbi:MAG: amidohydrolase family protein, partial [Clostridia bacterium]|nr:amidohydrolase family protein [Clostridia bacterium]
MTIIKNAQIISGSKIQSGCIAFENGVIAPLPDCTDDADIIDAGGAFLSAGFIDLHTHGGGGHDFMDGTVEAFLGAAELHAKHGTTTLLPTAVSGTLEETTAMIRILSEAQAENINGADMPGLHLEGPYFSPAQAGAQDPRFLKIPDPNEYLPILESTDRILRWSAACELDGAFEFAEACRRHGVLCAVGHSDADLAVVEEAIEHGFTHLTHFYSCMSSVHRVNAYRVCGVVEAGYLR